MFDTLHRLSAFLFYLLGSSFFVSYLLMRNTVGGSLTAWWLQVADLPLLLVGMLYGGISLYRSLGVEEPPSRALALTIALPLTLLFLFFATLNFWPLLP